MTDEQLAMVDTLTDTALAAAGDVKDGAMMLVAAAGNALTSAFGVEGAAILVHHAQEYHAVIVANADLRREQRGQQ